MQQGIGSQDGPKDWEPETSSLMLWHVSGIALFAFGVAIFAGMGLAQRKMSVTLQEADALSGLGVTIAITLGLLLLHELIHGQMMVRFGARPAYGTTTIGKVLPVLHCSAPGHRFSRAQYIAVAAAPMVIISLIGAGLVISPIGGWFVLPLAIHLAGCVGDVWGIALSLHQPTGTEVEDHAAGIRFHRPTRVR